MTDEPFDVAVSKALLVKLDTPAIIDPKTTAAAPIAYPFIAFVPVVNKAYLDAHNILRADPQHDGLAFTASTTRRGIFQVDVVAPDGQGEAPGMRLAALVAARFPIGTELVAGRYKIQLLQEPTIAAAVKDAPWVRFPVSIPYLVITKGV